MKTIVLLGAAMAAMFTAHTLAQETPRGGETEHVILSPEEFEWQEGPESLPPGAEFAVLEGHPGKAGMVTMRIRVPEGYEIPPHTHPRAERVTILEGELSLGMGRQFNEDDLEELEAGSFFIMQPGMEHYVRAESETVLQLTVMGPWEIRYVNLDDDPRQVTE